MEPYPSRWIPTDPKPRRPRARRRRRTYHRPRHEHGPRRPYGAGRRRPGAHGYGWDYGHGGWYGWAPPARPRREPPARRRVHRPASRRRRADVSGRTQRPGVRSRGFYGPEYYGPGRTPERSGWYEYARDYHDRRHRARPRAYDAGRPERRREPDEDEEWSGRERRRAWRGREERRAWRSRGRELLEKFREPIIGLTVAAATAPLARKATAQAERPTPPRRTVQQTSAAPKPELDEVERRWAEEEAEEIRSATIDGAIVRYGIDRGLAEDIYDTAVEQGIEPDMAFGLVNTESSFRHRAVSSVGARGLTQLMPNTARWLDSSVTNEDLFDRDVNLRLGFRYLNQLIDRYDGDARLALLAYNRGPGTVDGVLARGGNPENGYADRVLSG